MKQRDQTTKKHCSTCRFVSRDVDKFPCVKCHTSKHLWEPQPDEKDAPEKAPEVDVVVEPKHYSRWSIQPLTFIMANGFEFWRGNIIKYACRAGFKQYDGKDEKQSEITDLKKVIQYATKRIEEIEGVS
jgi:hypothetical protein